MLTGKDTAVLCSMIVSVLTIIILTGCSSQVFNSIDNTDTTMVITDDVTQGQMQTQTQTQGQTQTQTTDTGNTIKLTISYKNSQFGFDFGLPESWKGFSTITGKWEGFVPWGTKAVETGTVILVRHPEWTEREPRKDIPIMIFTYAQWVSLEKAEYNIDAEPTPPIELGKNSAYIFALPSNYINNSSAGFEEVANILNSNALKANENFSSDN